MLLTVFPNCKAIRKSDGTFLENLFTKQYGISADSLTACMHSQQLSKHPETIVCWYDR